jgi:hypothetical protein
MLRRVVGVFIGIAVVLLSTSAAFAQIGGDPNGVMPSSSAPVTAEPAAVKPFTSFTGIASGTFDFAVGACPAVSCSSGHTCQCFSMSSINLKATGLGASKFTANINVDVTTFTRSGAGGSFCDLAAGPATITTANGDTVKLDLTTPFCVGFTFTKFEVEGGWTVVGGTGKLANAAGTGVITLTGMEGSLPQTMLPVAGSMNGVFHK